MNAIPLPDPVILSGMKEYFAAGYFELPEASPMVRWSRAMRRYFEKRRLPPYHGQALYPCGLAGDAMENQILAPSYSFTWSYNDAALDSLARDRRPEERQTLHALRAHMRGLEQSLDVIRTPHVVGGRGYTHSIPNYGRIIREGLGHYAERIRDGLAAATKRADRQALDFFSGLQDLMAGIETWLDRILDSLRRASQQDPVGERNRTRLHEGFLRIPRSPARSFFEAFLAYNCVFYLDGCDNAGRVDLELTSFYEADLLHGATTHGEAVELLKAFWENIDLNTGWSVGIGGCTPEGNPHYTDLTIACLEAARGKRRPNLQLHVRRDMPEEVWKEAFATLASGCGLPALYNDELYTRLLRDSGLGIREEDLAWRNGGGCTETMIHGRSNVGSLDAGINLALILDQSLRTHLGGIRSFDALMECFLGEVRETIQQVVREVNTDQQAKALYRPQPMRSLLVDDCIEGGIEFNAGGARYNWSVINVAGLANVIDSLAALREVVFERKELTPGEMLDILLSNFAGREEIRARLTRCPRYGNDNACADDLAATISRHVFQEILRHSAWRGGIFLPSCLMFVTYADAGVPVGALPDGRMAGEPLADSAGPCQGRDTHGPTAMLRSVARLAQELAPGTLVVNMRILPRLLASEESRNKMRDLVRAYFTMGGMQLQINVVDQETLRDAIEHPERHADLIVRVGGYSEYFNRLSRSLQTTLLERTEHGAP